jgi:phosphoglycolate phosphatase-like HAD superfamily hydrolase
VYTIGVTWGAASRDEMARAGADLVIHEVGQLVGAVDRFAARVG